MRFLTLPRATLLALALWCALSLAATDPLADLKSAVDSYQSKRYPAAIATLTPLGKRLPQLADYVQWFLGSTQFDSKDFAKVHPTLEPIWKQTPSSPLAGRALLLAAKADLQNDDAATALATLRTNYAQLPQPQGDLGVAQAFAAAGDKVSAASTISASSTDSHSPRKPPPPPKTS